MVDESFAPVPVRDAPFFDEEVVGERMLRSLGAAVFGDADPTQFFYRGRPYTVRRDGDRYVLELELPFTSREEVKLSRYGDELAITVGSWRRNLILPRVLVDAETVGGGFRDHTLRIEFAATGAVAAGQKGAG
jgi:arsenite-transporting ATPase